MLTLADAHSYSENKWSIAKEKEVIIGVYRLMTKSNSNNFHQSTIHSAMERIKAKGAKVVVHKSSLEIRSTFYGSKVVGGEFKKFKKIADAIIVNRNSSQI